VDDSVLLGVPESVEARLSELLVLDRPDEPKEGIENPVDKEEGVVSDDRTSVGLKLNGVVCVVNEGLSNVTDAVSTGDGVRDVSCGLVAYAADDDRELEDVSIPEIVTDELVVTGCELLGAEDMVSGGIPRVHGSFKLLADEEGADIVSGVRLVVTGSEENMLELEDTVGASVAENWLDWEVKVSCGMAEV
jgi:hypothetical protein